MKDLIWIDLNGHRKSTAAHNSHHMQFIHIRVHYCINLTIEFGPSSVIIVHGH